MLLRAMVGIGASSATASLITWEFSGEVTFLRDETNLLGGAVELGDPFSGSFTFESTTPDANPGDPRIGLYDGAIVALSGYVADVPFTGVFGSTNYIEVINPSSIGPDGYFVRLDAELLAVPLDFGFQLVDGAGTVFGDDSMALSPLSLEDFEYHKFAIGDGSETIPLSLSGTVDRLVPEPGTLVLLTAGVLILGRRRRRLYPESTIRRARAITVLGRNVDGAPVLGMCLLLGLPGRAAAADCNANGVEDSLELSECPPMGVVFIMDTSASMGPTQHGYIGLLCPAINEALADLPDSGLTVNEEILLLGANGYDCTCCTQTVRAVYGSSTPGLPERLGTCGGCEQGNCEDWAPATAIVAGNKSDWSPGPRIVVPISDEGPRCGHPVYDPGSDRDAVDHAIPIARQDGRQGIVPKIVVLIEVFMAERE
ncbi:MAG: PEP-CTERM sorting domain-containing protein, partial [Phycisphaerae bacterium]